MPDTASGGFSRVCPSCDRKVPRTVATCRCGAELPVDTAFDEGTTVERPTQARGLSPGGIAALMVAALAVGGSWLMRPAPASEGAKNHNADNGLAGAPTAAAPQPEAPVPSIPSAAQRDWQLAVGLKDATPLAAAVPPASIANTAAAPVSSLEDVIGRAMPAVVLVETPLGRGSGFYVRPDTLLTNVHVVENNSVVTLRRSDGTSVSAQVVSRAPVFDIAVLRVLNPAPDQATIPLGNAAALRPGQDLVVIGSPLGLLQNTVTRGIVSALRRSGEAMLVQTDAAINPGNSGGPVLDRTGAAVGITTMSFRESQGLNFAVSIDHARAILEGHAPPSATALGGGASSIRNYSPTIGSETDRIRAEEQRRFEATIDELARAASVFDSQWRQFRSQCYGGSIAGTYDREWFAVLVEGAMPGAVPPACGGYFEEFKGNARKFQDEMKSANEAARRAGVYPGVIRDAHRSRQLDFGGWNR